SAFLPWPQSQVQWIHTSPLRLRYECKRLELPSSEMDGDSLESGVISVLPTVISGNGASTSFVSILVGERSGCAACWNVAMIIVVSGLEDGSHRASAQADYRLCSLGR